VKSRPVFRGFSWGLLLIVSSVFASPPKPILTIPLHKSEGLPFASVSLRWKYDEEPAISAQIEEQVEEIGLRVYETDNPDRLKFPTPYVGVCELYYPCENGNCPLEYRHRFAPRTFASTSECGEELKPEQWYRWSVGVFFKDGTYSVKTVAFKTGNDKYKTSLSIEFDKMVNRTWDWLTKPIERNGKIYTFKSIYKTAGIDMEIIQDEDSLEFLRDVAGDFPFTTEELHSFARKYRNRVVREDGAYVGIVSSWKDSDATWGITARVGAIGFRYKNSFLFADVIADRASTKGMTIEQAHLFTATHEVGHILSLKHEDSDRYEGPLCEQRQSGSCPNRILKDNIFGTNIMTRLYELDIENWKYEWSANSLMHFYTHPLQNWKPPASYCHWYIGW